MVFLSGIFGTILVFQNSYYLSLIKAYVPSLIIQCDEKRTADITC